MHRTSHGLKRFLLALVLVTVAAVIYVETAPGSLHSSPTPKQFKALSTKVSKLQKQVTGLKKESDAALAVIGLCIMHQPAGVDQLGTSTSGYLFGPPQTAPTAVNAAPSSALNLAPSTEPSPQHEFFELNTSQQPCVQLAKSTSALSARSTVAAYAAAHR